MRRRMPVGGVAGNIPVGGAMRIFTSMASLWICPSFHSWMRFLKRIDLLMLLPKLWSAVLPRWLLTWTCGVVATMSVRNSSLRAMSTGPTTLISRFGFNSVLRGNCIWFLASITTKHFQLGRCAWWSIRDSTWLVGKVWVLLSSLCTNSACICLL